MSKKQNAISFGKGWLVIIFSFIVFFFYGGLNQDGLNVVVPPLSENMGVEQGVLFTLISYASMIGVIIHIILGFVAKRMGAKRTIAIALFVGAIAFAIEAHVTSIPLFVICRSLMNGCTTNAAFVGCGILTANYFPKRKGIVMGYTTMGLNLNSACFVALLTALISKLGGIGNGVLPICACLVVLAIISIVLIKDTPQEIGIYPDNVSKEVYVTEYNITEDAKESDRWTTKKLLTTPMVYGVAITTGLFCICNGATVSNMVARNMEMGMSQAQAIGCMTVVAIVGLFGSWIVGVFDEKFGTKPTMIGFGIFYFVAGLLNWVAGMTGSMVPLYISVFMTGIGIGGAANFTTSLPCSVFGRHSFDKINTVLFPMQSFVISLNFLVSGLLRIITGNDLKWIYLAAGFLCLINVPLILLFIRDEHKYNLDFKIETGKI